MVILLAERRSVGVKTNDDPTTALAGIENERVRRIICLPLTATRRKSRKLPVPGRPWLVGVLMILEKYGVH